MPSIPSPTAASASASASTSASPSPSNPTKSDSQPSTARKEKVEKKTPVRKRDVQVKEKKLTAKEKAAIAEAEAQAAREAEKEQARLEAERLQQQRLAAIAAQAALARERDPSSSTRGFQRLILSTTVTSYDGEMHNGLYHGKGRATFKMGQTYDGEWDAGLMHGYGKYTWPDGSWYEGTLTASAITGRGIYHWIDGSTYDGDVEDGYRHGMGTFRDLSVPCIYEGAWSHGERHGIGRMIYDVDGKSWYYGEWDHNTRHGQGTITYASGNTYQGDWVRDRKTGHGTMTWHTTHESYTGTWVDDSPHGHGEYHWYHLPGIRAQQTPNGPITTVHFQIHNRYVGDMWHGERHGKGTFFYSSGAVYQGDWEHNRKHGHGRFVFENGSIYDGPFIDDRMSQDTWTTQDTRMLELPIDDILHKMCDDGTMGVDIDHNNEWDDEIVMDDETRAQRMSQIITTQKQLVTNLLLRYNSEILDVYRLYATLDLDTDVDPKDDEAVLKSLRLDMNQIWQFAQDCHMLDGEMTRAQLDRLALHRLLHDENYEAVDFQQLSDLHSPSWIFLVRQFAELLVRIAHHRFDADQVDVKTGKSVPVVVEEVEKEEKEEVVVETPSQPVVEVPVVVSTPTPAPVVETTVPEKKSRAGKRTSLKNTAATTTTEAAVTTPAPAPSAATVAPTPATTNTAPVAATIPAPTSTQATSATNVAPAPAPPATVAPSASSSTLPLPTLTITSSTASLASTSSTAALAALNARHLQLRHLTLAERVKKLFDVHILPYSKNRARWGPRYDFAWLPPHRLTRVIATTHTYDQQLRDMFSAVATEQREIGVLSSRPLHDLTITVRSFLRILSTRDMFLADRSRFGPIHILRTLTSPPLDGHPLTDTELYSNLEMEMIYAEFIESIIRVAIARGEVMAKIETEEEDAKRVAEEAQAAVEAAAKAAELGENAETAAASSETTETKAQDVLSPLTSPVTEPVVAASTPTSAPVSAPSPVLRPSINPNAPSTASAMNLSSPSSTRNRSRGSVSTPSRPSVTRRPSQGRERADSTSRASETSRGTQRGNLRRPHKARATRLSLITAPDVLQFTGSPDDIPHLTDADRAKREKDILRWCAMVQQFVLQLVRGKEAIKPSKPVLQVAAEEPSEQQQAQGEVKVV